MTELETNFMAIPINAKLKKNVIAGAIIIKNLRKI